jgi:hypothetical protein
MTKTPLTVPLVIIALLIGLVAALTAVLIVGGSISKRVAAGSATFVSAAGFSLYVEQDLGLLN